MVEQVDEMEQETDPYAEMRASKPWLEAIKDYKKSMYGYDDSCDKIDKHYASLKEIGGASRERQMQIFWANLEVLKPAIYSRPPVPVVTTRFKDKEPIVRHAAEVLERSLISSFEREDIDQTMIMLRDDLAVNARGVCWLRIEEDDKGKRVKYDHLDRKNFAHEPARKWKETGWVAREDYLSYKKMRERFEETSDDEYTKATYEKRDNSKDDGYDGEKKACVWEIWSKDKNVVVWVSEGCDNVLDIREPFLSLEGFFPCPRPAYGTVERGTLKPVPDYVYYKDQIEEINELTARISALSESLRMKGFYAGGSEDIASAIETAIKNQDNNAVLVPIPSFGALGGSSLKDSIIWLPVTEVATVIQQLIALRKQLIDDVYQITGISDIMRGTSNANETLGAQQLKSQYGSIRIRDRQQELIRIARDMGRIAAEIMAENFTAEDLKALSQYKEVPTAQDVQMQANGIRQQLASAAQNPQMMQQAMANPEQAQQIVQQAQQEIQRIESQITFEQVGEFLASERTRPFALDIETDSTIQPDEDAQKQRSNEFLTALSSALAQLSPMIQAQPQSAEFAGEVLKFAVAPYRAGRSLEAAIETFTDQMKQSVQQPKEDPNAAILKAEAEAKQADMSMKQSEMQMSHELKVQELESQIIDMQEKNSIEQMKVSSEVEKNQAEIQKIFAEIGLIQAQPSVAINPPEPSELSELAYNEVY